MAKRGKKQPQGKLGKINLTDHEREVIAKNVDTEFFKIITEKVIPQREVQIAMTLLHAGFDEKDLWFYKGMLHVCTWFGLFIKGEAEKVDADAYDNDDESISAEDDIPS